MDKKLNFEYGNEKMPRGNCFLYCAVLNDKFYFQSTNWIASNVFVSFLAINEKLPVVAFPPIPIENPAQLFQIAKVKNLDIIRITDFAPPSGIIEAKKYFQSKVNAFNEIVMDYVDLCGSQNIIVDESWDEQDDLMRLSNIEKRFIQSLPLKDQSSLESVLGPYYNDKLIHDNRFDFQNLWAVYLEIEPEQAGLVHLFFEKFRAVYEEKYEKAGKIQTKINNLIKN